MTELTPELILEATKSLEPLSSPTALKSLNDTGRVGGYLIVWGSPSQKDLTGEYFTPQTDLGLNWYSKRPALYHHGLDGVMKAAVIGEIDVLKEDETGVWAEAQLDLRKRYVQVVQKLIDKGVLGWSSGSLPHLVQKAADGRILEWPIVEGSMTPSPAEPRRTEISAIKSAYEELGLDTTALQISESPEAGEQSAPALQSEGTPDARESQTIEQPAQPDETPSNETTHEDQKDMDTSAVISAVLDAVLGQLNAQLSDEDKAKVMQAVMAGMQTEQDMSAERSAAVAQQAAPLVAKAVNDHFAAIKAARDAANTAAQSAVKNLLANVQPANGNTANGASVQQPNTQPANTQVYSKYQDLSPEDMVYMRLMASKVRGNPRFPWAAKFWQHSEDVIRFDREIADKIQRSNGRHTMTEMAAKAFDVAIKANELSHSTQASYGDEWVPDLWSNQLWRRARLDNTILPLFKTVEMPSNPFELPVEGTDPTVYYVPETTAETELLLSGSGAVIPDSKIGSAKVQMSAKKLALRVGFSAELTEDSIIPVMNIYREQAERAILDSIDYVLLNGDTTNAGTGNINLDDADPADTERYLAMDGLRHSWLVEDTARGVDAGNVAASLALIRQARFAMPSAYAMRPQDIAYIVGGEVYATLLDMPQFLTMDVIGQQATILNGQIGQVDGSPVLVSAQYGLTEADGKASTTANNNIYGQLTAVFRPHWYVGYRRQVVVDVSYLPYYDAYQLTATVRLAFVHQDNDSASGIYELAV